MWTTTVKIALVRAQLLRKPDSELHSDSGRRKRSGEKRVSLSLSPGRFSFY